MSSQGTGGRVQKRNNCRKTEVEITEEDPKVEIIARKAEEEIVKTSVCHPEAKPKDLKD